MKRLPASLFLPLGALLLWALLAAGCATRRLPPVPARGAELPARLVSHFFLVEAVQADGGVRRLMIDTGSTATLVSAEMAAALGRRERQPARGTVQVRSALGETISLEAVTLPRLQLGEAVFGPVPALIYDFSDLSAHLGLRIDGLVGFPVFRDRLLTLDYPAARLRIAPWPAARPAPGDARTGTLAFSGEQGTPLIPVQLGNESFFALIDSGSDAGLHLNPAGLHPRFIHGPRPGTIVSSLAGESEQLIGRVGQDLVIGTQVVRQPVVDLTDQLSALGGELLRHFRVTFDQRRGEVAFARTADGPIDMAARRSTGLALRRLPIYWRVMSVVPDTPTAEIGVQPGDLIIRINGELVDRWDHERFAALLAASDFITCTFISGTQEYDVDIPVFALVP